MKLIGFEIKNILGVSELKHTVDGNVVEISGKNGQGKTSSLEAIKDALGASSVSHLIRNGEEVGEVVLDFEDAKVIRKHKPNATGKTTVKARVGNSDKFGNITSPASFVKSMVNANSIDPARLLTAKPKELVDVVLNSMPIQADKQRIFNITGKDFDVSGHALTTISNIGKVIFDERTGINREGKQLHSTIAQLKATLPEEIQTEAEIQAEIDAIQDENISINESFNSARADVDADIKAKEKEIQAEIDAAKDEAAAIGQDVANYTRECEAEIERLQRLIQDKKDEITSYSESKQDEVNAVYNKAGELATSKENLEQERENRQIEIDNQVIKQQEDNNRKLNEANERMKQAAVVANTYSNIVKNEEELGQKTAKSNSLGEQLKMLNEYKQELCDSLPIPGLELQEGQLYMNGISFETLNTAERMNVVVKLAELNAGSAGVIVLDNTEMMDSGTYQEFINSAAETDLVFIVGRVTDNELTVSNH